MNASKQKERIAAFIKVTKSTDANAKKYLPKFNWDVEQAVAEFQKDTKPPSNAKNFETLFNKYKQASSPDIEIDGIERFCSDLGITPLDPVILVISKYFNAQTMGLYRKEEFVQGMQLLGCDTTDKLKAKLPVLRRELSDPVKFKSVYLFVFTFSREVGVRNLPMENAIQLWRLLLADRFAIVEVWIRFLESRDKKYDISKDTWDMLYDFLEGYEREGLASYDPYGAWPVLIDEFVEELSKNN